jgi:hypothetical protein
MIEETLPYSKRDRLLRKLGFWWQCHFHIGYYEPVKELDWVNLDWTGLGGLFAGCPYFWDENPLDLLKSN